MNNLAMAVTITEKKERKMKIFRIVHIAADAFDLSLDCMKLISDRVRKGDSNEQAHDKKEKRKDI